MAFVKLDCGILNSTLWMDRAAREVFITALLMAEPFEVKEPTPVIEIGSFNLVGWDVPPGWYGFVPAASIGIIGRAKLDPDEGMAAIRRLSDPDPDSRSPEFEGRRMVRINGGFLVLNFMKYRDFDHGAAERMRRFRERKKVTRNGCGVAPNDGERNANDDALPPNVTYSRSRRQKQKAEEEGRKESEGASRSVRGNGSEPELPLHGNGKRKANLSRKLPIPDGFAVDQDLAAYARSHLPGVDVPAFVESFVGKAKAKGWKYVDWRHVFQDFVRSAAPNSGHWTAGQYPKQKQVGTWQ